MRLGNNKLKAKTQTVSLGQVEDEVLLPTIDVDKLAIRFTFTDGSGCNLFWSNLFVGQGHENFHVEIMRNIHRVYNECVENNIHPHLEDEAT